MAPSCNKLLVTVHGIRTFGQWQQRLGALVHARSPDVPVLHYGYGYFSLIAFWIPPLRWIAVLRFQRELLLILRRFPEHKITLVGHSNGTYLIAWALRRCRSRVLGRIDQVILAGSVLKTSFSWNDLIDQARIRRVINDCGIQDHILALSQLFVLFTGLAGRLGFVGMTGDGLLNRYFEGGHSHYFESEGKPDDRFMKQFWVPLIVDDVPPVVVDARKTIRPVQGLTLWLLQNADLFKGLIYSVLAYVVVEMVYLAPRRVAAHESQQRVVDTAIGLFAAEIFPELALRDLGRAVLTEKPAFEPLLQTLAYQLPRFIDVRIEQDRLIEVENGSRPGVYFRLGVELHHLGPANQYPWVGLSDANDVVAIDNHSTLKLFSEPDYSSPQWSLPLGNLLPEVHGTSLLSKHDPNRQSRYEDWKSGELGPGFFLIPSESDRLVFLQPGLNAVLLVQRATKKARLLFLSDAVSFLSADCRTLRYVEVSEELGEMARMGISEKPKALFNVFKQLTEESTLLRVWSIDLAGDLKDMTPRRVAPSEASTLEWEYFLSLSRLDAKSECVQSPGSKGRKIDSGIIRHGPIPFYKSELALWSYSPQEPPTGVANARFALPTLAAHQQMSEIAKKVASSHTATSREAAENAIELLRETLSNDGAGILGGENRPPSLVGSRFVDESTFQVIGVARGNFGMANWILCQVANGGLSSYCVRSFGDGWGGTATFASTRYGLLSSVSEPNDTIVINDFERMEDFKIQLPQVAAGIDADFDSARSRLALMSSKGDIFVAGLESRQVENRFAVSTSFDDDAGFRAIAWYRDTLLIKPVRSSVLRLTQDGKVLWSSRGMDGISGFSGDIEVSEADAVAFVHDHSEGRLLSAETGTWLSGPISAESLAQLRGIWDCLPLIGEGVYEDWSEDPQFEEVRFPGNGVVAVRVGNCWFSRQAPLRRPEVLERLQHLSEITGEAPPGTMRDEARILK